MRAFAVAVFAAIGLALPGAATAAGLSDSFAARGTVKGLPLEIAGSTVGAKKEAGEPVTRVIGRAGHSVWLEWEAESTGFVTVSTCGSQVPTIVGVFLGTELQNLTELGSASAFEPECTPLANGVTFHALAGLKYEILVDGDSFFVPPSTPPSGEGAFTLRLEATPPPPNDAFAAATELTGRTNEEPGGPRFYFGSVAGHNFGATRESGEPVRQMGPEAPSVWYRWTAPESGSARISAGGSFGAQIWLGVYGGESLGSLQALGADADSVQFQAVAGTTYRIAVDGRSGTGVEAMSTFGLLVSMRLARGPGAAPSAPPPVDSLAPETTLRKKRVRSGARTASFTFAASEPGASFRCKLDRRKEAGCGAAKTYSNLAYGRHVLRVKAVDAAGNVDPTPLTTRFAIVRPQPRR